MCVKGRLVEVLPCCVSVKTNFFKRHASWHWCNDFLYLSKLFSFSVFWTVGRHGPTGVEKFPSIIKSFLTVFRVSQPTESFYSTRYNSHAGKLLRVTSVVLCKVQHFLFSSLSQSFDCMGFLSNLQRGSRLQSSVGKTGASVHAGWNNPADLRQMRGCLFHPLKASDLTSQRALGPYMTRNSASAGDKPRLAWLMCAAR